MKTIILKVVPCPPNVITAGNEKEGWRFLGSGDLKLLCGECNAVVMNGMENTPNVTVKIIKCEKCGSCNEVTMDEKA
jgi:hypothetical protein